MMKSKHLFTDKKICIIGTGGFAREVLCCIVDIFRKEDKVIDDKVVFLDKDEKVSDGMKIMGCEVIKESSFDVDKYVVVVAIGEPKIRKQVVEKFPQNTLYATVVHPSAIISDWVEIGEGAVITAGVIITCNIALGKHAHINLDTTIGHDCKIGNYFTTAPSVNISGNCNIADNVYFGTNSCIKQGLSVCSDVTIGMGGVVVKDINRSGIYIGTPAKIINV